jgi:predicted Zn-dependent protease
MRFMSVLIPMLLVACVEVAPPQGNPTSAGFTGPVGSATLSRVAARVMPVARRECQARASGLNCDFQLVLDERGGQPPNAFQSVGQAGQPVLTVNVALLNDLENSHELAFILGHEAAHHIRFHLVKTNSNATAGAVLGGVLAAILGADPLIIDTAQQAGAAVGVRSFSKKFELEADALGTVIAGRAGYDPVRGAAYFSRIADPGNSFLGTHPPNSDRIETVRKAAAAL